MSLQEIHKGDTEKRRKVNIEAEIGVVSRTPSFASSYQQLGKIPPESLEGAGLTGFWTLDLHNHRGHISIVLSHPVCCNLCRTHIQQTNMPYSDDGVGVSE